MTEREYLPSFAELIDSLTVNQIKEVLLPEQKKQATEDMVKIAHDINLVIQESGLKLTSRLIRIIIALAQMNVHIWHNKDLMRESKNSMEYVDLLTVAHQLNGVRNRLKNILLDEVGDKSSRKTNFNTDGLEGWEISV